MLPIVLDPARLDILLIGEGAAADKRHALLTEAGATRVRVFGAAHLPNDATIAGAKLVFIVDRTAPYAADLAARARAAGALVHIEDDPAQTDFHLPAVLRRGDLAIAISTGGASPALAVRLKRALGELFGPEWSGHTDELAKLRAQWRGEGDHADSLKHRTEELIERRRWLPRLSSRP
jgi:precorrin-2 dehydrogenase / sirohydrochlorin ferrochelatase